MHSPTLWLRLTDRARRARWIPDLTWLELVRSSPEAMALVEVVAEVVG